MDEYAMYQSGLSLTEVSKITGVPVSTLQYRIKKAGISRSHRDAAKLKERSPKKAHNRLDLRGQRFHCLTVLRAHGALPVGTKQQKRSSWLCRCKCGREVIVAGSSLKSGNTKSCGCLRYEGIATVPSSKTRTYRIWQAMLNRCRNKNSSSWDRYGGRGITVCSQWMHFDAFLRDMGEAPRGMSIDRINNDLGYCPDNCKWSTRREQNRNKSTNRWITFAGRTMILADWASELHMDQSSLRERLDKMSLHEALTTPKAR